MHWFDLMREVLLTTASAAVTGFSIYFAIKKIGCSVSTAFSISHEGFSETRINHIVLVNNKNKPLNIFSIEAVIDGDIVLEVEKSDVPITLGPYESRMIHTSQVSEYRIGTDIYKPEFLLPHAVELYLVTDKGAVKCKNMEHPDFTSFREFRYLSRACKNNRTFNGIVYNDNAKYAISYIVGNEMKTVLLGRSGFISGSEFHFNMLRPEDITSKEKVKSVLEANGYKKVFVDDLK